VINAQTRVASEAIDTDLVVLALVVVWVKRAMEHHAKNSLPQLDSAGVASDVAYAAPGWMARGFESSQGLKRGVKPLFDFIEDAISQTMQQVDAQYFSRGYPEANLMKWAAEAPMHLQPALGSELRPDSSTATRLQGGAKTHFAHGLELVRAHNKRAEAIFQRRQAMHEGFDREGNRIPGGRSNKDMFWEDRKKMNMDVEVDFDAAATIFRPKQRVYSHSLHLSDWGVANLNLMMSIYRENPPAPMPLPLTGPPSRLAVSLDLPKGGGRPKRGVQHDPVQDCGVPGLVKGVYCPHQVIAAEYSSNGNSANAFIDFETAMPNFKFSDHFKMWVCKADRPTHKLEFGRSHSHACVFYICVCVCVTIRFV
jgi:hypothetical protein